MQWSAASSDLAATFPLSSLSLPDLSRSVQLILEAAKEGFEDYNQKLIDEIDAADKELTALTEEAKSRSQELKKLQGDRYRLSEYRYLGDVFEFMRREWRERKKEVESDMAETSKRKYELSEQLRREKTKDELKSEIAALEPRIANQEAYIDALERQFEELSKICSQEDEIREKEQQEMERTQSEIETQQLRWYEEQKGYCYAEKEYKEVCARIEETERKIDDVIVKCKAVSLEKIAIQAQSEHKQREFERKERLSEQVYGDYRMACRKMLELGISVEKQEADCCAIGIKEIESLIAQYGDLSLAEFLQHLEQ